MNAADLIRLGRSRRRTRFDDLLADAIRKAAEDVERDAIQLLNVDYADTITQAPRKPIRTTAYVGRPLPEIERGNP